MEEQAISDKGPNRGVSPARVVLLSREESFCAPERLAGLLGHCIRVESPYEAAAELLAAPAVAMVIDLRCFSARHAPLIKIASHMGAETIGCGRVPQSLPENAYSGMHLLAAKDLASRIQRLIELDRLAPPVLAEIAQVQEEAAEGKAVEAAAPDSPPLQEPAGPQEAKVVQASARAVETAVSDVLTPQELSALLGDGP